MILNKLMCFAAFFSQYLIQFNIALSGANYTAAEELFYSHHKTNILYS